MGTVRGERSQADQSVRLVRTLTFTIFLQWLGASAIIPMLPVFIRHLGGSDVTAGVVMASFFAAGVLLQYPTGRLADRIGRRPVLVGGLLVFAAASLAFLFPITPGIAVVLRGLQGAGAGGVAVASLAMISGAVALERRGRAFAAIYGGEIAGLTVGPLVGSIVGAGAMWTIFLGSAVLSAAACIPALRIKEQHEGVEERPGLEPSARPSAKGRDRLALNRSAVGSLLAGSSLGLSTGVYEICWTLLLLSRGASGFEIGVSWTLFAVPFVLVAKPSGWLADHFDRRVLVIGGIGLSAAFCATYPFIASVPALVVLGAVEAMGFAAALPSMQSLLTQGSDPGQVGRLQGLFATGQTACTALAAAAAGAMFATAAWLPFVSVTALVVVVLAAASIVWRTVPGRVGQHLASTSAPATEPAAPSDLDAAPVQRMPV